MASQIVTIAPAPQGQLSVFVGKKLFTTVMTLAKAKERLRKRYGNRFDEVAMTASSRPKVSKKRNSEITPAIHQARLTPAKKALAILSSKIREYQRGGETMGVIGKYELKARHAGATSAEIESLWNKMRGRAAKAAKKNPSGDRTHYGYIVTLDGALHAERPSLAMAKATASKLRANVGKGRVQTYTNAFLDKGQLYGYLNGRLQKITPKGVKAAKKNPRLKARKNPKGAKIETVGGWKLRVYRDQFHQPFAVDVLNPQERQDVAQTEAHIARMMGVALRDVKCKKIVPTGTLTKKNPRLKARKATSGRRRKIPAAFAAAAKAAKSMTPAQRAAWAKKMQLARKRAAAKRK